jgi:hypothetical protein
MAALSSFSTGGFYMAGGIDEAERQRRMEKNVSDLEREMNGLLYTPGQELAVLQKLQMVVSVEPTLLARADLLSVLQRILEKTADPGTARAAIVFANEYMHIDDVVLGANSLGLYQLVEMGETHNRNALGQSPWESHS